MDPRTKVARKLSSTELKKAKFVSGRKSMEVMELNESSSASTWTVMERTLVPVAALSVSRVIHQSNVK